MISKMTEEQRTFADEHHNLVYAFLNARRLSGDEYYDIVVFGYLQAVVRYLTNAGLRERYNFSTIAYTKMCDALCCERIRQNRQKRRGVTISLETVISADGETVTLGDSLSAPDPLKEAFETEMLLQEMSEWLAPQEMAVISLRKDGYCPWEISRKLKMQPTLVHDTMRSARNTVFAVCA